MVIDPVVLNYSVILGGSNWDLGTAIAVDSAGNAYVAGVTASTDYWLFQQSPRPFAGGFDVFVVKLDAEGRDPLYVTYLGGSGWDLLHGAAVDAQGRLFLTGETRSDDFPTANPRQPARAGRTDAFVAKLGENGDVLLYSTYLGGTKDDRARGIAVDSEGNAYVAGETDSPDFPLEKPFLATLRGGDAFVTKLDASGANLVYSTYLGGSGADGARGIGVDRDQNAYVAGVTASPDFPTAFAFPTPAPAQAQLAGWTDGFVTKLNATASKLVYSTYLGGSREDEVLGMAVLGKSVYLTGSTRSPNFPVLRRSYDQTCGTDGECNPGNRFGIGELESDAFVSHVMEYGLLAYSTFLGGSESDAGYAIAVNREGEGYVTGVTYSKDFPRVREFDSDCGACSPRAIGDVFVAKFDWAAAGLLYSSYLGGTGADNGRAIAVGGLLGSFRAYLTGDTNSEDFPHERKATGR